MTKEQLTALFREKYKSVANASKTLFTNRRTLYNRIEATEKQIAKTNEFLSLVGKKIVVVNDDDFIISKERIIKEINEINNYIDDCTEDRSTLLNNAENFDECELLYDQIRKYNNYKAALEQVVSCFPTEIGGY